jgi:Domain of Unknown Function (DUF1080)
MNNLQKNIITLFVLLALGSNIVNAQEPKLKKIFNGKNLKGWVLPDDKNCYTVSKKILTVKNEPTKKGSILWTEKSYSNFVLQADFKMEAGTVDSGFFLKSEENQIQIGISGSLKRDLTGSPYIPKKRYPVEANVKEILKPNDWNTMKIKMVDKTYTVWLNGQEVLNYTTEIMPDTGPIGIQLHPGNEMTILYKNIVLAELN